MALWLRVLVALPEDQGSMVHNSITFNPRQRYSVTLMEQYKSHDQTQTKAEALPPRSDPSYSCTSSAFVLFHSFFSQRRTKPVDRRTAHSIGQQLLRAPQSPPQICKEPESQNKFLFVLAGSSHVPSLLATNQQTQFGSSLAVFPVVFG